MVRWAVIKALQPTPQHISTSRRAGSSWTCVTNKGSWVCRSARSMTWPLPEMWARCG